MSQIERISLLFLLVFGLCSQSLQAQLYPGDANNDGWVNQYDVLAIGYAYGSVGPARIESGTDASIQGVPLFWATDFPNGDNFAYADTDGNGQITIADFAAVYQNYGDQWFNSVVIPTPVIGTPLDPRLGLGTAGQIVSLQPGHGLSLPLLLGNANEGIQNLNGIAFRIRYHEEVFTSVNLSLANNWLSDGLGQAVTFQRSMEDQIDIALSRFGVNPLSGSGGIGTLSFVIVEDMIDLIPEPYDTINTCIFIEGILAMDGLYDTIPIFGDSLCINLYNPDAILANEEEPLENAQVRIIPNPLKDRFSFWSDHAFYRLDLIDMQGRTKLLYNGEKRRRWREENLQLPAGCYAIRMYAEEGVLTRKVIIQ